MPRAGRAPRRMAPPPVLPRGRSTVFLLLWRPSLPSRSEAHASNNRRTARARRRRGWVEETAGGRDQESSARRCGGGIASRPPCVRVYVRAYAGDQSRSRPAFARHGRDGHHDACQAPPPQGGNGMPLQLHAGGGRGWRCQCRALRQAAEGGVHGARAPVPKAPCDCVRLDLHLVAEVRRHLGLWPPSRDGGCRVHQAGLPARRRRPLLRQAPFLRRL